MLRRLLMSFRALPLDPLLPAVNWQRPLVISRPLARFGRSLIWPLLPPHAGDYTPRLCKWSLSLEHDPTS